MVADTTQETWRPGAGRDLSTAVYPPHPIPTEPLPSQKLASAHSSYMTPIAQDDRRKAAQIHAKIANCRARRASRSRLTYAPMKLCDTLFERNPPIPRPPNPTCAVPVVRRLNATVIAIGLLFK